MSKIFLKLFKLKYLKKFYGAWSVTMHDHSIFGAFHQLYLKQPQTKIIKLLDSQGTIYQLSLPYR